MQQVQGVIQPNQVMGVVAPPGIQAVQPNMTTIVAPSSYQADYNVAQSSNPQADYVVDAPT